jgi:cobalamin biosynthesis protein CobT
LEVRELEHARARLVQQLRKRHLIARELLLHLASASSSLSNAIQASHTGSHRRVWRARDAEGTIMSAAELPTQIMEGSAPLASRPFGPDGAAVRAGLDSSSAETASAFEPGGT